MAGSLFLLFLANRFIFFKKGFLGQTAALITYPVIVASNTTASLISWCVHGKNSLSDISQNYKQLKAYNSKLVRDNIVLKTFVRDHHLSHELQIFQKRYDLAHVLQAKVIARNFSSGNHYLLVDAGSRDGVRENMVAIYKQHVLGKVTEVYAWYSKIMLISDPRCRAASFLFKQAQGIARGNNVVNHCHLDYINRAFRLQQGDLVLTSGQGLVFPAGYCLGRVKIYHAGDKYYDITVESLVDFRTIPGCLLIDKSTIIKWI
jgi:rod shape-determining protein MreC